MGVAGVAGVVRRVFRRVHTVTAAVLADPAAAAAVVRQLQHSGAAAVAAAAAAAAASSSVRISTPLSRSGVAHSRRHHAAVSVSPRGC